MNQFKVYITLLFLSITALLKAQNPTFISFTEELKTTNNSQVTLVYKLTDEQAFKVIKKEKLLKSVYKELGQPIDTLPKAQVPSEYKNGYYLFAYTYEHTYWLKFRGFSDVSVIQNDLTKAYHLHVFDGRGEVISEGVTIDGKKRTFNKSLNAFVGKVPKGKTSWLSIKRKDYTHYYQINRSKDYSYSKKKVKKWGKDNQPQGYLVFNKPKYRPEDSLKYKVYLVDKKGKPYRDSVFVYGKDAYGWKSKEILLDKGVTNDYGVFVATKIKPDAWQIDKSYQITVKNKEDKSLVSNSVSLEDYKLEQVNVELKVSKSLYRKGDTVLITANAKDANGLVIPDAEYQLKVSLGNGGVSKAYTDYEIFKTQLLDTTLTGRDVLNGVKLLPSELPALSAYFEVSLTVKTAEGKPVHHSKTFQYDNTNRFIDIIQKEDSLFVTSGTEKIQEAYLFYNDERYEKDSVKIQLPYEGLLKANDNRFNVKARDLEKEITIFDWSRIRLKTLYNGKEVSLKLENPYQLPVTVEYMVKGKLVQQQHLTQLDSIIVLNHPVDVKLTYFNTGKIHHRTEHLDYNERRLQVSLDLPHKIYPSETKTIKIQVKDFEGKPVPNADLTLVGINNKFNASEITSLPNQNPRHKSSNGKYRYHVKAKEGTYAKYLKDSFGEQESKFGLDTLLFYQTIKSPDSITIQEFDGQIDYPQLVPYIFEEGELVPVHYVFQGSNLVYLKGSLLENQTVPLQPSAKQVLTIRTTKYRYTIDSIQSKIGKVTVLKLNGDELPKTVKREKVRGKYTKWEQGEIERNIWYVRGYFDEMEFKIEHKLFYKHEARLEFEYSSNEIFLPKFKSVEIMHSEFNGALQHNETFAHIGSEGLSYRYNQYRKMLTLNNEPNYVFYDFNKNEGLNHLNLGNSIGEFDYSYNDQKLYLFSQEEISEVVKVSSVGTSEHLYFNRLQRAFDLAVGDYKLYFFNENHEYCVKKVSIIKGHSVLLSLGQEKWYSTTTEEYIDSVMNLKPFDVKVNRVSKLYKGLRYDLILTDVTNDEAELSGKITTEYGKPLKNINVSVPDYFVSTKTDLEGFFTIPLNNDWGEYDEVFIKDFNNAINITLRLFKNDSEIVVKIKSLEEDRMQEKSFNTGYSFKKHRFNLRLLLWPRHTHAATYCCPDYEEEVVDDWDDEDGLGDWGDDDGDHFDYMKKSVERKSTGSTPGGESTATGLAFNEDGIFSVNSYMYDSISADFKILQSLGSQLRNDFRDDAIWEPNIRTDDSGYVTVTVTFPDDITKWDIYAISGQGKRFGITKTSTKAYKPVSAKLYAPRFAVEGDTVKVQALTQNNTKSAFEVTNTFVANGKTEEEKVSLKDYTKTEYTAVAKNDSLTIKYTTSIQSYTDGEERKLPVYPKGLEKAKGMFAFIESDTILTYKGDNQKPLHISVLNSSLDSYKKQLEDLVNYQYNCNEQMASKLIALAMLKYIAKSNNKPFLQTAKAWSYVKKLKKNRNNDGLWGWWNVSGTSVSMSIHIIEAFEMAHEYGIITNNQVAEKAKISLKAIYPRLSTYQQVQVLSLLSKSNIQMNYLSEVTQLEERLKQFKTPISIQTQLHLLRIRQQQNIGHNPKAIESFLQTDILGNVYAGDHKKEVFENDIVNSVLAYDILKFQDATSNQLKKMERFLLMNQSYNAWGNTYWSAKALSVLVPEYKVSLKRTKPLQLNGKEIKDYPFTTTWTQPKTMSFSNVTQPYFVGAYQNYWDNNPMYDSTLFAVKTKFVGEVKFNEKVMLEVSVRPKKQANYVQVTVPIPAGMEYTDKSKAYNEVHREYYKDKVIIYFDKLYASEYKINIQLFTKYKGEYSLNPAKAELMYFEQLSGNNELVKVRVK